MKKIDWKLVKKEENTAEHYVSDWGRLIFWSGKNTFALSPKGKQTRYLRHMWEEDHELIFNHPKEAYQLAYEDRTFENRNDEDYNFDFSKKLKKLLKSLVPSEERKEV